MMILQQTFSLSDIPRVAVLAFLELLLSADNAIVLGLISSRLPSGLRNKALYIGFISAWFLRLAALLTVSYFLEFYWLQLAGGLYLLYQSIYHFVKKGGKTSEIAPSPSFWKTIVMIEIFDLVFAVDSIIAGVAFIGPAAPGVAIHPKLWIVYIGGMIGVFAIRYASRFFSTMIHRFPRLETSAYGMIGWIGLKLGMQSLSFTFPYYETLFWAVLLLIFALGLTKKVPPPNV